MWRTLVAQRASVSSTPGGITDARNAEDRIAVGVSDRRSFQVVGPGCSVHLAPMPLLEQFRDLGDALGLLAGQIVKFCTIATKAYSSQGWPGSDTICPAASKGDF
jgi:hypothetical protein